MSNMKWITNAVCGLAISFLWIFANVAYSQDEIRVGIIGLDTSHAPAFTRLLNAADDPEWISGAKVVAAVPQGSHDIESSVSRVPEYTTAVKKYGVKIVDTVEILVEQVDAVLLESNDGRVHLEQVVPVLAAGKPVGQDVPYAAMGGLTGFSSLAPGYMRFDPSGARGDTVDLHPDTVARSSRQRF